MFFNTGGYREDIWIKNNILGRKTNFIDQNVIGPGTNLNLAFLGVGLAFLIKSHNDDGGTVLHAKSGVFAKNLFAFLHGDGINNWLAL